MDFVKLSEQRFTAKKFDVNKKIPRDDVEKLKTILQLSPSSVNSQPWVFLWGTSDNSKKRVRPAIADFNWNRIDTCSDFVVIAVRKGLDDKFQHTLLDQEIKDGRIANEEIAKECFEIGILPSETTEHAVYPTFDFLKSQLGHKYRFKLFDISNHDFLEEINVLKPHLLFAPSEIYLQLAAIPQLNAHDIAALKSVFSSKTSASVGSVFITRADRNDINSIADMKGKRVAAANNENLSEWWAALGELKERGYTPNRFFGGERFTRERHLGAVEEVLAGSSDVGILPTCLLETYEGVGFVAPGSLKVIDPYDNAKDESPFYCRRSTRALYPGIVISSLANAPDDIVKDVVRTLFTMPPFQGNEWAAGYDYTEVLRLMRDLKFGMYENLRDYSLGALLQRYKTELLILLTILLFLIGNELRVHHLVNKRTAELKGALEAKNAAEQEAVLGRKRLSHIERSGVISQMSNIIAHELKQPLGALLNYAAVLKLRLNDRMTEDPLTKTVVENMDAETRRISHIVDSVRKFAKKEQPAHIEYDLVRIVEKAIRTFHQQEEAKTAVPFRTDVATAPVLADPLSLELLI